MLRKIAIALVLTVTPLFAQSALQLTPSSGRPGTVLEVMMNAPVDPAARITFEPPGLVVSNVRLTPNQDATQFTLTITEGAQPGAYTFVYEAPSNPNLRGGMPAFRQPNAFTVLPPPGPVVRQVLPPTITAGAPPVEFQILGANFSSGARVDAGPGVQVTITGVWGSEIAGTVSALADATPGPRNVIVTNRDGTASQPGRITVLPRAAQPPRARAVTPSSITAGTMVPVTITGEGFAQGLTISGGAGVSVAVTYVSATQINAAIAVEANAPAGPRNIVVTNPDGLSDPTPPQITVVERQPELPVIRTITPSTFTAGTTTTVTITGENFQNGVRLSIGDGVTASVTSASATQLIATFVVAENAPAGPRTVIATNPDGRSNANQPPPQITILPPAPRIPRIHTITPSTFTAGTTTAVTVTGENFQSGLSLTAGEGVRVTVGSVSPTQISATFAVDAMATPGPRGVVVRNPDGSTNANQPPPQIAIVAREPERPRVRGVTPSTITAGTTVPVVISGENFRPGASVNFAGGGLRFTPGAITETTINGTLTADANAAAGARAITVTNPDGAASPPDASAQITVVAVVERPPERVVPVIVSVTPPAVTPGQSNLPLAIVGSGFQQGATVAISGTGITIRSARVESPTAISAIVDIARNAEGGPRFVVVRNPDGTSTEAQQPQPRILVSLPEPPRPDPRLAPRVELVTPRTIDPGVQTTLTLQGVNFAAGMTLSLGNDVTVLAPPFVRSPREATVTVLALPSVAPGTRTVTITGPTGSATGPGSVLISSAAAPVPTPKPGGAQPARPAAPPVVGAPKRPLPKGDIILEAPLDPDSVRCAGSATECAPDVLTLDTVFRWRETNPGIADYFTIEIIDPYGKVLASAQTKQRHYRVTSAFLGSIPPLDPDGARKSGTPRRPKKNPSGGSVAAAPKTGAGAALAVDRSGLSSAVQAKAAPMATQPLMPGGGVGAAAAFLGDSSAPGPWQDRPGIAYWRVIGFYDERDVTGKRSGNFVAVEQSNDEGIILPLPPSGAASCETARSSATVKTGAQMVAGLPDECRNPAMTCAGEDVTLSGTIDLSRVPFDVGASMAAWPPKPVKTSAANEAIPSSVSFSNVFIDWGDGTEPERLSVASTAIRSASIVGLSALATYSGAAKGDAGAPLRHRYRNPSPPGGYTIRIYSVSDPDRTPAYSVASASHTVASMKSERPGASLLADARKVLGAPTTHLIACTNVTVVDPPGASEGEGLHLIGAAVEWPSPYDTMTEPKVSACSEALRPRLRLDYWGQGRVRVSWLINGDSTPLEQTELTLTGVSRASGEARKLPRFHALAVPLPLSGSGPNSLVARVEVIETAPPPAPAAVGGKSSGTGSGKSLYGSSLSGSLYSLAEVNTVVKAGASPALAKSATALPPIRLAPAGDPGTAGPRELSSAPRAYSTVPIKEGEICRLVYATTLGDFVITDLTQLEEKGGTFTGRGTLRVDFPTGSGSTKPEYVPMSFSGWELGPYNAGERRVTAGTADAALTTTIHPLNFAVKLSRVRLAPDFATVDGAVSLTASQLPSIPGGTYPSFPFSKLPINPSGDLYFEISTPVEVPLGFTGFKLRIARAVIDFSTAKGDSASAAACKETTTGAAWTGILVSGVLGAPDFSFGSAGKMLPDIPIENWSFGAGGFSAELHRDLKRSLALAGDLAINVGKMDLVACNSSFDAKVGLQLTGVPLIEEPFAGEIQVTSSKGILAKFGGTAIKKDWKVVALNIGHADFNYDPSIGDWAVRFDADVTMKLPNGVEVYKHEFAGFKVTLDGKLASPGGSDWVAAGDTGPASLGGFPVQVTKIGAGARAGGGVWFGISGLVQFAKILKAEGSDIRFKLDRAAGGGYRMGGVDVGNLHIDFSYPEGSPTVRARADIGWQMEGSAYRFAGEGGLSIIGSLDVSAGFLYGRDPSIGSYWLAKASTTLPAPIALGPTPLGLFGVGGGLAYKVPIEAFDIPITKVKPSGSAGYLFSALVKVGTFADGGFTVFADGRLTIGTGAGVRLDVGAWLLSKDHAGAPHAKGCIQYAGGSFDAGFGVNYRFAGDQIVIDAPSGPDTCKTAAVNVHFGSDGWHVWLGSEPNPIKVKVLIFNGRGYLMADSSGIRTGVTADFQLRYSGSIAGFGGFVEVGGSSTVGLGLGFDPFSVSGRYGATVNGRAGVIVAGEELAIGLNCGVEVQVSAPPFSACGNVHVAVEIPVFPDITADVSACI